MRYMILLLALCSTAAYAAETAGAMPGSQKPAVIGEKKKDDAAKNVFDLPPPPELADLQQINDTMNTRGDIPPDPELAPKKAEDKKPEKTEEKKKEEKK